MNNEHIVTTIKGLCKTHNISISELEKKINVSQGLISRWNKTEPSLSKIIDIANYFKVSIDELVRYDCSKQDPFIEKLILQTVNKTLIWNDYNKSIDKLVPKQYHIDDRIKKYYTGNDSIGYYTLNNPYETSYYTCIKSGYVSIYTLHEFQDSKKFGMILLFIQPSAESELIQQKYNIEQVIPLWLKILYSLGEYAPDDIKAEELKNAFLSNTTPFIGLFSHEMAHVIGSGLREKK